MEVIYKHKNDTNHKYSLCDTNRKYSLCNAKTSSHPIYRETEHKCHKPNKCECHKCCVVCIGPKGDTGNTGSKGDKGDKGDSAQYSSTLATSIITVPVIAFSLDYQPTAYFPWSAANYQSLNGSLIYYSVGSDTTFDIRIRDVFHNIILAINTSVSTNGIHYMPFNNPPGDALIVIDIKKNIGGVIDPVIYAATLNFI